MRPLDIPPEFSSPYAANGPSVCKVPANLPPTVYGYAGLPSESIVAT